MRKHRNLFREKLDSLARAAAKAGTKPLTHIQRTKWLNDNRPHMRFGRAGKVSISAVSRSLSYTAGVARRFGPNRRWVVELLGIDYEVYLRAWGTGPEKE